MLSLISRSLSHNESKRVSLLNLILPVARRGQESRTAPTISRISREQQSTQVRLQYIDVGDKSISLIVFNFTEYLTSTLCINLPFSYLALNLLPQSIYLSAILLLIIVPSICLIAKPPVLYPRLLPKN
jgi:hypothetical protein